ncbi:tetratricopeptide repeat protein [bacterium]|nr:tetratricopeptide repeat protein [bacterium]
MIRQNLLHQLSQLLQRVSQSLSKPDPQNACASCFSCCTARGLTQHRVSEIEFALIEERVGQAAADRFRTYIAKKQDAQGNYVYERCPNYDWRTRGCGVYEHRPFACRVFGHLKPQGTSFPSGCYYSERAEAFPAEDYFDKVPGAQELRFLSREFSLLTPPVAAHYLDPEQPAEADVSRLGQTDPVDRALLLQLEGRLEEAAILLIEARGHRLSLYLDYCLACLLTQLEQHEPALALYETLLESLPERRDFNYYAGYHALQLGQRRRAREHFLATVEALPNHSLALGFLGYMELQQGGWLEAEVWLLRACAADPDNPYFRARLQLIREKSVGLT